MSPIETKTVAEQTVAFIEMQGPYALVPEAMGRLYGWIQGAGLTPEGMPGAVYFTSPEDGPPEQMRWDVWAPLAGDPPERTADEQGIGIKRLPGRVVAYAIHKGPYETVSSTYDELGRWLSETGRIPTGPPEELYLNDPGERAPDEYLTEVRMPIAG